jgi:nickel-type superoxide dismutase maturation protease
LIGRIRVTGNSMWPSLREGQVLWSDRLVYRLRRPRRGEVVVVDHPTKPLRLVKRVLAVPGDAYDGRRLGPDEYYVAGDNPAASTDSAHFGPIARSAIRGRVWTRR